jgi:hypothetical protein
MFGNAQALVGHFFGHLTMDGIPGSAERLATLAGIGWRNKNSEGRSVLFLHMRIFNIEENFVKKKMIPDKNP